MCLYDFMRQQRIDPPHWINDFNPGDPFPIEEFFASRIVYYPGSGTDGQPVRLFASTHSAYCFVYADYAYTLEQLENELAHPQHGFHGYRSLHRLHLERANLTPDGWAAHNIESELQRGGISYDIGDEAPFALLEILERDPMFTDDHGARRLAILLLRADGIASYDALFCQQPQRPPFAVVLQDHGFGGCYDAFGGGSLLERIARRCDVIPQWLLVGENTQPWQDFERVPNVDADRGGMHNSLRLLFTRA